MDKKISSCPFHFCVALNYHINSASFSMIWTFERSAFTIFKGVELRFFMRRVLQKIGSRGVLQRVTQFFHSVS